MVVPAWHRARRVKAKSFRCAARGFDPLARDAPGLPSTATHSGRGPVGEMPCLTNIAEIANEDWKRYDLFDTHFHSCLGAAISWLVRHFAGDRVDSNRGGMGFDVSYTMDYRRN